ncbi:hypothetical protein SISSUDRAFT_1054069 [Sistotremastrum suecicum HHB10207 ss-3]|uniref:Uncharacterized protein n=1 Tax=Sistotremastrum suecicum HHB10207 ss-3 TaxID=1314776 RepID=A0A165YT30_9AGAM|nr:hypothetical protein SISSUDRAFT_1054069 [Sistotremastrum suecicum HHB10207 ss-3]
MPLRLLLEACLDLCGLALMGYRYPWMCFSAHLGYLDKFEASKCGGGGFFSDVFSWKRYLWVSLIVRVSLHRGVFSVLCGY